MNNNAMPQAFFGCCEANTEITRLITGRWINKLRCR